MTTIPNETDKSAPSGSFQAIVACDTNIAFARRNLFFVIQHQQSFRILSMFKPLLILDSIMDKIAKIFKRPCWIEDLK